MLRGCGSGNKRSDWGVAAFKRPAGDTGKVSFSLRNRFPSLRRPATLNLPLAALPGAEHLPLPILLRSGEVPMAFWGEFSHSLGDAQPLGRAPAALPVTLPEGSFCNPHSGSSSRRSPVLGKTEPPDQSRDTGVDLTERSSVAPSVHHLQRHKK